MQLMDLADELGVSTRAVKQACERLGIDAAWAGAEISERDATRLRAAGVEEPDPVPSVAAPPAPVAPPPALPPLPLPPPSGFAPVGPTPFGPADPLPVRQGIVLEKSRHPMVSTAWGEWWRGVAIWFGVTVVTVMLAGLIGVADTFADAYRYRPSSLSFGSFATIALLYVGGTGYATLTWIRSASTALDAWPEIEASGGRYTGQGSVILILVSAVLACVVLLVNVVAFAYELFG